MTCCVCFPFQRVPDLLLLQEVYRRLELSTRMSVQVTYEASCDQKFKDDYQNAFYAWVNTAGNAIIQTSAGAVEFDQAHVLYVYVCLQDSLI